MRTFDFFGTEEVDIAEVDMDELNKDREDPIEDYYEQEYDSKAGDEDSEGDLIRQNLDPVKATEHFIRMHTGLSSEELDVIEEEATADGEEIIENGGSDDGDIEVDDDSDSIDGEEISEDPDEIVSGGSDDTEEYDDGIEYEENVESEGTEIAMESLRYMFSSEDEGEDGEGGGGDTLELGINYGGTSKNISIQDGSVSISDGGSDDGGYEDSSSDEGEDDGEDDSEDGEGGDDQSGESFLFSSSDWL